MQEIISDNDDNENDVDVPAAKTPAARYAEVRKLS